MDGKLSNLDCNTPAKKKRKQPTRRVKREGNDNDNKTGRKKRGRWDVSKYCWSCGGGNHDGPDCKKKKPGHKDKATFTNMMGGCTDYCQVISK